MQAAIRFVLIVAVAATIIAGFREVIRFDRAECESQPGRKYFNGRCL